MKAAPLFGDDFPDYRRGPAVKPLRQVDLGKVAAQLPITSRDDYYAGIQREMDHTGMAGVLLNHLWLVASKRCACGLRSEAPAGQHYSWWASHVAGLMVTAGYSAKAALS